MKLFLKRNFGVVLAVWVALWFVDFGAVNADLKHRSVTGYCSVPLPDRAHHDYLFSIGWGISPFNAVTTPWLTHGYRHGFDWSERCR